MRMSIAFALALTGCTVPNPDWAGPGNVGSGGAPGGNDAAAVADLGAPPVLPDLASAPPDLAPPPPVCAPGDRECAPGAPPSAQLCTAGGQWSTRACPVANDPSQAICMAGFCQPPTDGQNCLIGNGPSEDTCYNLSPGLSCQPFIDPQSQGWMWFCARAVGAGASGDACTDGSQCRSGYCGSNGTCFRACQGPGDCPQHTPALKCQQVTFDVEGVKVFANGCVP